MERSFCRHDGCSRRTRRNVPYQIATRHRPLAKTASRNQRISGSQVHQREHALAGPRFRCGCSGQTQNFRRGFRKGRVIGGGRLQANGLRHLVRGLEGLKLFFFGTHLGGRLRCRRKRVNQVGGFTRQRLGIQCPRDAARASHRPFISIRLWDHDPKARILVRLHALSEHMARRPAT